MPPMYDVIAPIKADGKRLREGRVELTEAVGARLVADGYLQIAGTQIPEGGRAPKSEAGDAPATLPPAAETSAAGVLADPTTPESECSKPEAPTDSPAVVVETASVPAAPEVSEPAAPKSKRSAKK